MWVNPRLATKLSESYANGEVSRSFGENYLNSHMPNSFNNFADDENWIRNNNEGINTINNFSGNTDGFKQQMRFNEIANQVLNQQREYYQLKQPNQSLLDFADNLAQPFNNANYRSSMANLMTQRQKSCGQLNQSANATKLNECPPCYQAMNEYNDQEQQMNMPKQQQETFIPYSMEKRYREGKLKPILDKDTSMVLIAVCIIGFILFMLVQLYMSQKRLEYMVQMYRDVPINNLAYNVSQGQKQMNEYALNEA